MTGRDLIIYILENNLEDTPILETVGQAAERLNVGVATVHTLITLGFLNAVMIKGTVYITDWEVKEHE